MLHFDRNTHHPTSIGSRNSSGKYLCLWSWLRHSLNQRTLIPYLSGQAKTVQPIFTYIFCIKHPLSGFFCQIGYPAISLPSTRFAAPFRRAQVVFLGCQAASIASCSQRRIQIVACMAALVFSSSISLKWEKCACLDALACAYEHCISTYTCLYIHIYTYN